MKTAFVTGATGFLGLNLVEQLTARGWRVVALCRPTSPVERLAPFAVEPVEGDIGEPASLAAAIPPDVDAVFHVAANISVWSRNNAQQYRDNVDGTVNMLAAARAAGAKRFVHTSTWNVFGLEHDEITEATPQTAAHGWVNYDRTKYLAEQAVRRVAADGFPAVILNPANIIGRYDRAGWSRIILMVAEHRLPGIPPGVASFCHGAAVAEAHIAAAERGWPGENYLLGGADASFLELVRLIGEITGEPVPKRPVPGWVLKAYARFAVARAALTGREPDATPEGVAMVVARTRLASTKAIDELGYRPASLRAMVEDSHAWLRAEGLLP